VDIFVEYSVGVVTGRDKLAIHFTAAEAYATAKRFTSLETEVARAEYKLGPDAQDWKVSWAQQDIKDSNFDKKRIVEVAYQPFDLRWTYYTGKPSGFHVRPRRTISDAFLQEGNIALVSNRSQEIPGEWTNIFAVSTPATHHTVSNKEVNTVFPASINNHENFSPEFRTFLDALYQHRYTPEQILGLIYAVLHAPAYRARYAEFLRIDFPRIPFPDKKVDFDALSAHGWDLVQAHLLKKLPPLKLAELEGKGHDTVDAVRYSPQEQTVWFNATQGFKPVPQDVWEFHIGGYQVLEKYLKSRKSRELSLAEVEHVGDIARSLAFTIAQMAKIDTAYKAAFPDRG